jgi:drug/metabolite transporter (DMT)-like permease
MNRRDTVDLVLLAALWGASFLFMRIAAPLFGALPLAALRVGGAALLLLPMLAASSGLADLRRHWRAIALVGLTNSALPFACFAFAALSISAGLASILNATSALFAAAIAIAWLREPTRPTRVAGLFIGLAGVAGIAWNPAAGNGLVDGSATHLAIALCLLAAALYGFSACFARRTLAGVPSLAVAAGSQFSATLLLALPAWWAWPAVPPPPSAWLAMVALALFCTGLAYVLYFRLIERIGPSRAITVTFLVPAFALLWGGLFLGETPTSTMLAGCAAILLGTALATGIWPRRCTAAAPA